MDRAIRLRLKELAREKGAFLTRTGDDAPATTAPAGRQPRPHTERTGGGAPAGPQGSAKSAV